MRNYRIALGDIAQAILRIERFVGEMDREHFLRDDKTQAAVLWELITIGEAAKNIPEPIRREHPNVPWRQMTATRDFLAHGYYRVEAAIIWDIIIKDLPELKERIRLMEVRLESSTGAE